MWEHTRDRHDGVVGEDMGMLDYQMKVTKKFEKCLYRQVLEDIRMQHCVSKGGSLLNSKNEYYTPKVFRLYSSNGETRAQSSLFSSYVPATITSLC